MNWLKKTSTQVNPASGQTMTWQDHIKKSLDVIVPGEWVQTTIDDFDRTYRSGMEICDFHGKEIMIKPNSRFFVQVTLHRKKWSTLDPEYGKKDTVFRCYVKASSINKWPSFGKVIGDSDGLNTPFEIAKFVENCIRNYIPDDEGGDGGDKGDDLFPKWPYPESEFTEDDDDELARVRSPRIRGIKGFTTNWLQKIASRSASENALRSLIPQFTAAAQKIYNEWDQSGEYGDPERGFGGICDLIADAIVSILHHAGFEAETIDASIGEQHTWVVCKTPDGVYKIDIPPCVYETGAAYTWKKIPEVEFGACHIDIDLLSADPEDDQHIDSW